MIDCRITCTLFYSLIIFEDITGYSHFYNDTQYAIANLKNVCYVQISKIRSFFSLIAVHGTHTKHHYYYYYY